MFLGRCLLKHNTTYEKEIEIIVLCSSLCITKKSAHRFCCFSGICAAGKAEVRQYKNIQLVILLNNYNQIFLRLYYVHLWIDWLNFHSKHSLIILCSLLEPQTFSKQTWEVVWKVGCSSKEKFTKENLKWNLTHTEQ